jgi:hypothetical protein
VLAVDYERMTGNPETIEHARARRQVNGGALAIRG